MIESAQVPSSPLFFLSYARDGNGTDNVPAHEVRLQVIRFFEDLSENVARLTARRPGADPGFMDRTIRAGTRWSDELLSALGTCQVFIALICGAYTTSEWCAMEWDGFSQRQVADATGNPGPLVPVIWAPYPRNRIPHIITDLEWFSPGSAPNANILGDYEEFGLSGLLWTKQEDSYRVIVWRLARHIADFCHNYYIEEQTPRKEDLRDIFQESLS